MLVLTLKRGEGFILDIPGGGAYIGYERVVKGNAKISISVPDNVRVLRADLLPDDFVQKVIHGNATDEEVKLNFDRVSPFKVKQDAATSE